MSEIKTGRFTLGLCNTNCYYIYREGLKEAVVIDPADKGDMLYDALKVRGLSVAAILLTHGHFDHIYGVKRLKDMSSCKVYAGSGERKLLADSDANLSLMFADGISLEADVLLNDNEEVLLAGINFKTIFTPGHTEGSVSFYVEEAKMVFSGDSLFFESVGRTDFPTGSMAILEESIRDRLLTLPGDTTVLPGHGESTTIEHEKENNPFLS